MATIKTAREVMGDNFFGPGEVAECFGVALSGQELARISEVPWSESTLQECKDSHICFLGVDHGPDGEPLTINRFLELFPDEGEPRFSSYPGPSELDKGYVYPTHYGYLYSRKTTPQLRWYLIRKTPLAESRGESFFNQDKLLSPEKEYREQAVIYVYAMLLMARVRKQRLFENERVLCADEMGEFEPDYMRATVGYSDAYWSRLPYWRVGAGQMWWFHKDDAFVLVPALKPESE